MKKDTIIALATPPGKSGVAIIRLSGQKAVDILQKITKQKNFVDRYLTMCDFYCDNFTEHAMAVVFFAPKSFTGENVVEINCHGGEFITNAIIEKCIQLGCRYADRGEFSLRAFLNGKISIDQAEGIAELIASDSEKQAQMSNMLLTGKLKSILEEKQDNLKDILATIEAKLDYPEYDVDEPEKDEIKKNLDEIIKELTKIKNSYNDGKKINNGVNVVIVGAPNAGKSSLLNGLVGKQKAIVTDIAGTTRDIIEGNYFYNGIKFNIFDTAGLRSSNDTIEKIGISLARNKIKEADVILNVLTPNEYEKIDGKNVIYIFNKSDIYTYIDELKDKDNIILSATNNKHIDVLKEKIYRKCFDQDINSDMFYLTNIRHFDCISEAVKVLNKCRKNIGTLTLDFVAADIGFAWKKLGEITGVTATEEIINKIFSKFCLGK